jgi:hypothetical protein
MWMPWRNKTGLAKAAVILTMILSIATISYGLNVALRLEILSIPPSWAGDALLAFGWVELAAVVASVVGLMMVLVVWLASRSK